MNNKYKAVFLIPKNAKRVLGDDGWEFSSDTHLPKNIIDFVTSNLSLSFEESYLGIDSYKSNQMKASVIKNESLEIEHVYIQVFDENIKALSEGVQKSVFSCEAELFSP